MWIAARAAYWPYWQMRWKSAKYVFAPSLGKKSNIVPKGSRGFWVALPTFMAWHIFIICWFFLIRTCPSSAKSIRSKAQAAQALPFPTTSPPAPLFCVLSSLSLGAYQLVGGISEEYTLSNVFGCDVLYLTRNLCLNPQPPNRNYQNGNPPCPKCSQGLDS